MRLEKLEPSRHREGRWLVWLADGSLIRVGEGDVLELGLYAGKELSEEERAALTRAEEGRRLRERALQALAARPMSRTELVKKLSAPPRRRGGGGKTAEGEPNVPSHEERAALTAAAQQVADQMEELGLLNDGEYARTVARHYAGKGYGLRKIQQELYRRGVPRTHWVEALSELSGEETGSDRLDELLRRKLRGAEPSRENLKKASDYLARRGFGWEEISSALERYAAGAED